MLTNPESWTPHATYEATKLFVSNLDANQAQQYLILGTAFLMC
jgi:essential nuclear protein 1